MILLPTSLTMCPLETIKGQVCVRACACVRARACVRACVRACACVRVLQHMSQGTALVGPSSDLVSLGHVPSLFRYLREIQKGMASGMIRLR